MIVLHSSPQTKCEKGGERREKEGNLQESSFSSLHMEDGPCQTHFHTESILTNIDDKKLGKQNWSLEFGTLNLALKIRNTELGTQNC